MPMISPDEAWRRIEARVQPLAAESLPRHLAAGRVLAEPVCATIDVPGTDVSAMDGYAIAGEIIAGERRPVCATIAAGAAPGLVLAPGQIARIMTGAPLPEGADRIVPVEATRRLDSAPSGASPAAAMLAGTDLVEFLAGATAGDHIRRRGEVQRTGSPLLSRSALLTPGAMSLAATHGLANLTVYRTPSVAILTTGDEVVAPNVQPAAGQLRDSHTDFLLAAGRALGHRFVPLGIAPDRKPELEALVRFGLSADVLLVCGGVSMGEFDFVEEILDRLGCSRHFDAVAVQPGKPLVFATHPGGVVFGLPGNPASVIVDFWLFVRPTLALLAGREDVSWWQPMIEATLASPLPATGGRDRFLAAEVSWGGAPGGGPLARPVFPKGSHDLVSYAIGTTLLRVPRDSPATPAGARCEILLLPTAF